MKVFLAGTSFHPSYGGPAVSVSRLAFALCVAGVEVGLWAPDGSAMDSPVVVKHPSLRLLDGAAAAALDRFGGAVVIHDSGIWLGHNHQLAKLASARGIPRVVTTRGMLEPWAMNHKKWKKRLAWWLYQRRDLRTAAALHATAGSEAESLRRLGFQNRIVVIPNGVGEEGGRGQGNRGQEDGGTVNGSSPSALPLLSPDSCPPSPSTRTALFLSRIHSIKGLPMLVEAWAKVRPTGWRMRVVGPDEDGHRAEVEALVRAAGLADEWTFDGPLEGGEKRRAFAEADLFILPTHSENFGIAVAEALAAGLPVITTHGAPWQGLEEHGCGWWTPVSAAGIADALQAACNTNANILQTMGARGRDWMRRDFGWEGIAAKMLECYEEVVGKWKK